MTGRGKGWVSESLHKDTGTTLYTLQEEKLTKKKVASTSAVLIKQIKFVLSPDACVVKHINC